LSPVGLVPHSFPPVEVLEFRPSDLILVPLFYGLKNHGIVISTLPIGRFLIVDLIDQEYLLVVGGPVVFWILRSSLMMHISGAVVGVSYGTSELHSRLSVAFNTIHRMYQPIMNLKKLIYKYDIIVKRMAVKG
jgi:hypothetical protein